ncbi:MAG TPA: gliding motility-associated C-terminal domain-containing protein, partial [Panacibacter sp.]|nr:gliding motility-associated C-terminal domain-containing protein [Panacibacter sp.]
GNYMLVNAESTPGTVYTDTAKNLCENTNYVFAAWISNAMQAITCNNNPVLANVTLTATTLDGTVLATTNTGNIPTAFDRIWKQYGVALRTPPGITSVIISITTDPKSGCGSGFVLDDITFRSCGPLVSVTLDGSTLPGDVCADYTNPFILQGVYSPGFNDPVVQWQKSLDTGKTWLDIPGETSLTYAIPRRLSGVINYRMVIAERESINSLNCRIASNSIHTEIHPLAAHKPPQSILGCLDKDLYLPLADPSALSVLWKGPNNYTSVQPAAIVPKVQYADTGLYTLKESFYFGCTSLDTFYLRIFPSTTIYTQPAYPICEGMSENLSVSSSGGGTYKWYPSTGLSSDTSASPIARPTDSTEYKVVVTNSYGCKDSAFLKINVYRNPVVNAGPDKVILGGDTAILNGSVKGTAVYFSWSPPFFLSDAHVVAPNAFPPESNLYTLSATSTVGCGSAIDNALVKVYNDIFIPTAFTPNGDGKNDRFQVLPLDNYKLIQFFIYNRWGQLLFKAADKYSAWDGSYKGIVQPNGTYIYRVELLSPQGKRIIKQGSVLLLH